MSDDIVERLRDGCVLHPRRWSGDTHADLGGTIDEDATDAVMVAAANEIERLRNPSWKQVMAWVDERYPTSVFDGSSGDEGPRTLTLIHEVEHLRALITAWADAEDDWESICSSRSPDDFIYNEPEVRERQWKAHDALRKAVGR